MPIAAFILAMVRPLLGRILVSLGFSVVTLAGLEMIIGQIKNDLIAQVNTLPADMLNVFLLSGGGVALGLMFGAITTRLVIWQAQRGTKILGTNPG